MTTFAAAGAIPVTPAQARYLAAIVEACRADAAYLCARDALPRAAIRQAEAQSELRAAQAALPVSEVALVRSLLIAAEADRLRDGRMSASERPDHRSRPDRTSGRLPALAPRVSRPDHGDRSRGRGTSSDPATDEVS